MEMFNGTLIVVNQYKPVWLTNIPFKTEVDNLTVGLDDINDYLLFDSDTESATGEKNQTLEDMLRSTEIICNAGIVHASKTNDSAQMPKFNFSYSDLKEGKEIEIYQRCSKVGIAAIPVEAALIAVGMPITQLVEQKALSDKFRPLISGAKRVRRGGKSNKEEMLVVYKQMDLIYNERMDNMMGLLKKDNPKFFIEYTNSREIGYWKKKSVVPPSPSTLTGTLSLGVTSSSTGLAISGAALAVLSINYGAVTDANGALVNEKMVPGTYIGRLTCEGYIPIDFTFKITKDQICELGFMMEPIA